MSLAWIWLLKKINTFFSKNNNTCFRILLNRMNTHLFISKYWFFQFTKTSNHWTNRTEYEREFYDSQEFWKKTPLSLIEQFGDIISKREKKKWRQGWVKQFCPKQLDRFCCGKRSCMSASFPINACFMKSTLGLDKLQSSKPQGITPGVTPFSILRNQ